MKYELRLQMNFRSAFGELKRQTKDKVSCSVNAPVNRRENTDGTNFTDTTKMNRMLVNVVPHVLTTYQMKIQQRTVLIIVLILSRHV